MKTPIYYLLFMLLSSCSMCEKEENPTPVDPGRSDKNVLSVTVSHNSPLPIFPEVVTIDDTKNLVYLRLSDRYTLNALSPDISVSEGATIEPASGTLRDFSDPVTYTVKAEDGTQKTYTFIASIVEGAVRNTFFNGYSVRELEAYRNSCHYFFNANDLTMLMGCNPQFVTGGADEIGFTLRNKTLNDNLVGTYDISSASVGVAIASFSHVDSPTTFQYWDQPLRGTLQITKYDAVRKLISGSFTDVAFFYSLTSNDEISVTGTFVNVTLAE